MTNDCFRTKLQPWGTFVSLHDNGDALITSLTEEQCIITTQWYLQAKKQGFPDDRTNCNGKLSEDLDARS